MLRCGFFSALGLAYTNCSTTLPPVVGSVIAFTGKSHNKMMVVYNSIKDAHLNLLC